MSDSQSSSSIPALESGERAQRSTKWSMKRILLISAVVVVVGSLIGLGIWGIVSASARDGGKTDKSPKKVQNADFAGGKLGDGDAKQEEGVRPGTKPTTQETAQDENTSAAAQEQKTSTAAQEQKTSTAAQEPKTSTAAQDKKTSTAAQDKKTNAAAQGQKTSTAAQEPKTSTAACVSDHLKALEQLDLKGREPERQRIADLKKYLPAIAGVEKTFVALQGSQKKDDGGPVKKLVSALWDNIATKQYPRGWKTKPARYNHGAAWLLRKVVIMSYFLALFKLHNPTLYQEHIEKALERIIEVRVSQSKGSPEKSIRSQVVQDYEKAYLQTVVVASALVSLLRVQESDIKEGFADSDYRKASKNSENAPFWRRKAAIEFLKVKTISKKQTMRSHSDPHRTAARVLGGCLLSHGGLREAIWGGKSTSSEEQAAYSNIALRLIEAIHSSPAGSKGRGVLDDKGMDAQFDDSGKLTSWGLNRFGAWKIEVALVHVPHYLDHIRMPYNHLTSRKSRSKFLPWTVRQLLVGDWNAIRATDEKFRTVLDNYDANKRPSAERANKMDRAFDNRRRELLMLSAVLLCNTGFCDKSDSPVEDIKKIQLETSAQRGVLKSLTKLGTADGHIGVTALQVKIHNSRFDDAWEMSAQPNKVFVPQLFASEDSVDHQALVDYIQSSFWS